MTLIVQYEVHTDQAERFFTLAGYRARNMETPFSRTAGLVRSIIFEQFETQGAVFPSPGYGQWAPLNPAYEMEKVDPRIGRFTGEMHRSAMKGVRHGNDWLELAINRYTDDGTDVAEIFQDGRDPTPQVDSHGDMYMGGGQPERPLWKTTPMFKEEVHLIFWTWLQDLKNQNRRRTSPFSDIVGEKINPTYFRW